MRFPYCPMPSRRPLYSLGNAVTHYLPILPVWAARRQTALARDGLLDSGSTDTVFPLRVAQLLGIDLSAATEGQSTQVGGTPLTYRYAPVDLRISDGRETCHWIAIVGFLDVPGRKRAILGHAGFLQFFDATLLGADQELTLTPNRSFPGQHVVHPTP